MTVDSWKKNKPRRDGQRGTAIAITSSNSKLHIETISTIIGLHTVDSVCCFYNLPIIAANY